MSLIRVFVGDHKLTSSIQFVLFWVYGFEIKRFDTTYSMKIAQIQILLFQVQISELEMDYDGFEIKT